MIIESKEVRWEHVESVHDCVPKIKEVLAEGGWEYLGRAQVAGDGKVVTMMKGKVNGTLLHNYFDGRTFLPGYWMIFKEI